MKNRVIEKTRAGFKNVRSKLAAVNTAILVAMPMTAAATSGMGEAKSVVSKLLDLVVSVIGLFGGFLLVSGIFKLFMTYRTDNPEGQSAAAKDVVIGAVIAVFRLFAWPVIEGIIATTA